MLGRRDPRRSLFEVPAWPHHVPADSFYARLGAVNDVLFHDDDLAEAYGADKGRPSLPPSLLSGITVLQFYEEVSDRDAITRLNFERRGKVALHLALDVTPPNSSSWSIFRDGWRNKGKNATRRHSSRNGLWRHESHGGPGLARAFAAVEPWSLGH